MEIRIWGKGLERKGYEIGSETVWSDFQKHVLQNGKITPLRRYDNKTKPTAVFLIQFLIISSKKWIILYLSKPSMVSIMHIKTKSNILSAHESVWDELI